MTPDELRAFRDAHDLTRAQVAALLGVAPGTVRNWEQGFRNMPAPTDLALRRLTRAMIERVKRQHPPKRRAARDARAAGEG
jgi:DNA-binding transcriptional regulator YiaG